MDASDWRGIPAALQNQTRIKGNLVRSRARYVRETWGDEALATLSTQVSGEARRYLQEPEEFVASSWYDYAPLIDVDLAIIAGPMKGRWELMQPFGAEIAFYDLNTVYRALIRLSSPAFLLSNIGLAHSLYFSKGKMTGARTTDKSVTIKLRGGGNPRYMCTYGFTGWFCGGAAKTGAQDIVGEHPRCMHLGHDHCEWLIRWS